MAKLGAICRNPEQRTTLARVRTRAVVPVVQLALSSRGWLRWTRKLACLRGMSPLVFLGALGLLLAPIGAQLNFGETLQSSQCSFANFQVRVDAVEAACWCV